MSTNFDVNDERSTLGAGVKVMALVAVVGMIALAAGKGTVLPDELAAEQPAAVEQSASAAPTADSLMARYGLMAPSASTARDPSVPADADVIFKARDEASAPTF